MNKEQLLKTLNEDFKDVFPPYFSQFLVSLIEAIVVESGGSGGKGWSPILSIIQNGNNFVQQLINWTGGNGVKPEVGFYIGATGFVSDINDAVPIQGPKGEDGKNIELQKGVEFIQWRITGDPVWVNLVSLADLKGDTGSSAYEEWLSLGNTGTKQDFIDSLKGEQGDPGTVDTSQFYTKTEVDNGLLSKAGINHEHAFEDILGLSDVLNNLQQQINDLQETPVEPDELIISAGIDRTITLPTNEITLSATITSGIPVSWLWERISGPQNNGTNYDLHAYEYNESRTFIITPHESGNTILDGSLYQPGDRLMLFGNFPELTINNLIGTELNPIFIQNLTGTIAKIGDNTGVAVGRTEGLKMNNCRYFKLWGTDIESLVFDGSTEETLQGGQPRRAAYKNIMLNNYTEQCRLAYFTSVNGGTGIWAKKEVVLSDTQSYDEGYTLTNLEIDNCIGHDWYNEMLYIGHTAPYWNTTGQPTSNGSPLYPQPGDPTPDPEIYKKPIKWNGVKVHHCYFYDGGWDAIQVSASDNVEVYNNHCTNWATLKKSSDCGGILIGGGCTTWSVKNNWLHDSWGDFVQIFAKGSGLIENNLLAVGQGLSGENQRGIFIRMGGDPTAVVTIRKNTVVNFPFGATLRVNGHFVNPALAADPNQAAHIAEQNIFALPSSTGNYIYKENQGKVTEGTGNNANLKQMSTSGLDTNNYYLPDTSLAGFRKGSNTLGITGTPGAVIVSPNQQTTQVTGLVTGIHEFKITAKRADDVEAIDTMVVTVDEEIGSSAPPSAIAGPPQTTTNTTITLDGSASQAGTNPITSYTWAKTFGPAGGTITNPNNAVTTVTNLPVGIHTFELTVTDSESLADTDSVDITIEEVPSGNAEWFSGGKTGWDNNEYNTDTGNRGYAYLPEGYDEELVGGYPCIIFLHGQGERGSDPELLITQGLSKLINEGQISRCVHFHPQLWTSGGADWPSATVKKAYDFIVAKANINLNKVYLVGLSLGAKGTIQTLIDYPALFAGYAVSSIPGNAGVSGAATIATIPGMWVGGTADSFGIANTLNSVDAVVAQTGRVAPKVRVIYGGTHSASVWNDKLFDKSKAGFDFEEDFLLLHSLDPLEEADNFVTRAENSASYLHYSEALPYVSALEDGAEKTALEGRLTSLLSTLTPVGTRRLLVSFGSVSRPATGNYTQVTAMTSGSTTPLIDTTGASTGISIVTTTTSSAASQAGIVGSYLGLPLDMYAEAGRIRSTNNNWKFTGLDNGKRYNIRIFHCTPSKSTTVNYGFTVTIGGVQQSTPDHHYNTMNYLDWFNIAPSSGEIAMTLIGQNTPNPNEGGIVGIILTEHD